MRTHTNTEFLQYNLQTNSKFACMDAKEKRNFQLKN